MTTPSNNTGVYEGQLPNCMLGPHNYGVHEGHLSNCISTPDCTEVHEGQPPNFHCNTTSLNLYLNNSDKTEKRVYIPMKFWFNEQPSITLNLNDKISICSDPDCTQIGTRFDAASIELFACKDHEKKWYAQMIDFGVACLTSHTNSGADSRCPVSGCTSAGFYMSNNIGYCYDHAEIGAIAAYIGLGSNVRKIVVGICKNNHKDGSPDNKPNCSTCGEKLKFE